MDPRHSEKGYATVLALVSFLIITHLAFAQLAFVLAATRSTQSQHEGLELLDLAANAATDARLDPGRLAPVHLVGPWIIVEFDPCEIRDWELHGLIGSTTAGQQWVVRELIPPA